MNKEKKNIFLWTKWLMSKQFFFFLSTAILNWLLWYGLGFTHNAEVEKLTMDVKHDNKTLYEIVTSFLLAGRQRTFHQSVMQQTKFLFNWQKCQHFVILFVFIVFYFWIGSSERKKGRFLSINIATLVLLRVVTLSLQSMYANIMVIIRQRQYFSFAFLQKCTSQRNIVFFSFYYTLSGFQRKKS